jgi:cytoskeleton protein RodZ
MPEIGETLRETRMRRRIDMTEVEAATKIRAKYLRALENEEWDLLPGPTFVKTFLRTYAEYLELDPRLLVEEYRQRYERPSTQELTPFRPGRRRRRPRRHWGPGIVIAIGVLALVAALYGLSLLGQDNESEAPVSVATPKPTASPAKHRTTPKRRHRKHAAPTRVTLRLTATAPVYVCLENASGHAVLKGVTLAAGQRSATYRSRRFRANFGNGNVRMRINGHTYRAARTSDPVGYEMRPTGRPRRLSEAARVQLCHS